MPELPEVEVVRLGLAQAVASSRVVAAEVRDPRAVKRHVAGAADFEARIVGVELLEPARRGKFLWIPTGGGAEALLAHLGMSGQLLLRTHEAPEDRHVRVRLWLETAHHGELRLDFADQRLFGSLALDSMSDGVPRQAAHIARDPLDPLFDDEAFLRALRTRSAAVKKLLLDQNLISGVGNIYADEALWLARVHPETPGCEVSAIKARRLLEAVRSVFLKAFAEGGTSFDRLYVNVNGESGQLNIALKRVEGSRRRVISQSDLARQALTKRFDSPTCSAANCHRSGSRSLRGAVCA